MVTLYYYNPAKFWAKVDKTGNCWNWTAFVDRDGYGTAKVRKGGEWRGVGSHRVAYQDAYGEIPGGMTIDHACQNRRCVNPGHLRLATVKQNAENRTGARSDSKTGVRGVRWNVSTKRFSAAVGHKRSLIRLGYFKTVGEAEAAVIAKRNELFTHNDMDRQAV